MKLATASSRCELILLSDSLKRVEILNQILKSDEF